MAKGAKSRAIAALAALAVLLTPTTLMTTCWQAASSSEIDYKSIVKSIDYDAMRKHIEYLSSFSRFPGSKGAERALEYVAEELRKAGVEVRKEPFEATTLTVYECKLRISYGGEAYNIEAHPLYPNGVETCTTPPEGITGRLVYVGRISLEDLRGKDLNGAIALAEFDSGKLWADRLVSLGAKGVVFIEPEEYRMLEVNLKWMWTIPLDFPRVVVDREHGKKLIEMAEKGAEATIMLKMEFEKKTMYNLVGEIKINEEAESILFVAHYDAWSPIVDQAYGATDAVGVAVMIELARFLSKNRDKLARNVMFLATAGNGLSLLGARMFIEQHFDELADIPAVIAIDIRGLGSKIAVYDSGSMYKCIAMRQSLRNKWLRTRIEEHSEQMQEKLKGNYTIVEIEYNTQLITSPTYFYFSDLEPFLQAGMVGHSFFDKGGEEWIRFTPHDTADKVNLETSKNAIELLYATAYDLATGYVENRVEGPLRVGAGLGFATIEVRVMEYNFTKADYDPLPNAIVLVLPFETGFLMEGGAVLGNFRIIEKTDSRGRAKIVGIPSGSTCIVAPFKDSPSAGPVEYAPNAGMLSLPGLMTTASRAVNYAYVAAFRCASVFIPECENPLARTELEKIVFPLAIDHDSKDFLAMKYPYAMSQDVEPFSTDISGLTSWAMLYLPPGKKFDIIIVRITPRMEVLGVLTNAMEDKPLGEGLVLEEGQQLILTRFMGRIVHDTHILNLYRIRIADENDIYAENPMRYMEKAEFYRRRMEEGIAKNDYLKYISNARAAWKFEARAHGELVSLLYSAGKSTYIFLLILLPFAVIGERLVFEYRDIKKRLQTIALIFAGSVIVLYVLHPGFRLLTSFGMILAIFLMSVFTTVAIFLIGAETWRAISETRKVRIGLHEAEISRAGAAIAAFSVGIRNLRKRKDRTIITILSIVLVTAALVSSVSVQTVFLPSGKKGVERATPYSGILLKQQRWNPLDEGLSEAIASEYSSVFYPVTRRVWLIPLGRLKFIPPTGEVGEISGVLGLDPEEAELLPLRDTITEGRWLSGSRQECLISKHMASVYGIKVGEKVSVGGREFTVVGIFDDYKFEKITDLDGYPARPAIGAGRAMLVRRAVEQRLEFITPSSMVIVTSEVARGMGGYISSVAAKLRKDVDIEKAREACEDIAYKYSVVVIFGHEGTVEEFEVVPISITRGITQLLILVGILMLTILDTMLAAVHERKDEISIYSAVGLSPLHVMGLFLAEALTIGVIGAVLGYVGGMGMHKMFNLLGILTELHPNVTTSWIPATLVFVVLVTCLSSLYPLSKAATLVTPGVERRFKLPSPKGDEWHIPLPFTSSTLEAEGVLAFLREYIEGQSTEREGDFTADKLWLEEEEEDENIVKSLTMVTRHAPWDFGISNIIKIRAIIPKAKEGVCKFDIYVKRRSGYESQWKSAVRKFVDHIRKQLLIWRGLSPSARARYTGLLLEVERRKGE